MQGVVEPQGDAFVSVDRGETVLLMEDEPAVRELPRTVLEHCHYQVIESYCGVAAREFGEITEERLIYS